MVSSQESARGVVQAQAPVPRRWGCRAVSAPAICVLITAHLGRPHLEAGARPTPHTCALSRASQREAWCVGSPEMPDSRLVEDVGVT